MADATAAQPATCTWCMQEVDAAHHYACVLCCGRCGYKMYHQDCVEAHLRKLGLTVGRLSGFTCPHGRGKGCDADPCPGRIDSTHRKVPKGKKKKAAVAAMVAAAAPVPRKQQPVVPKKQSAVPPLPKKQQSAALPKKQQQQRAVPVAAGTSVAARLGTGVAAALAVAEIPGMEPAAPLPPPAAPPRRRAPRTAPAVLSLGPVVVHSPPPPVPEPVTLSDELLVYAVTFGIEGMGLSPAQARYVQQVKEEMARMDYAAPAAAAAAAAAPAKPHPDQLAFAEAERVVREAEEAEERRLMAEARRVALEAERQEQQQRAVALEAERKQQQRAVEVVLRSEQRSDGGMKKRVSNDATGVDVEELISLCMCR